MLDPVNVMATSILGFMVGKKCSGFVALKFSTVSKLIILCIMDDSVKVAPSQEKEFFKAREIDFEFWETDIF